MASASDLAVAYRARLRTLATATQARIRQLYAATVAGERQLPLSAIALSDVGRVDLSETIIQRAMAAIASLPPVVVVRRGARYELLDGRHRIEAARRLGRTSIGAVVVETADIDAAFAAYLPGAVPIIEGAQRAGAGATVAYLGLLASVSSELDVPRGIIGTTREGATLANGMAAFAAMVKGQIGKGEALGTALLFGRFLALRFADAEVTGAVDRTELELGVAMPEVRGWEGILSGDSCPACRRLNPGFHPMSQPMYRHGGCDCTKRIVTVPA